MVLPIPDNLKHRGKVTLITCIVCGKQTWKSLSESTGKYCSPQCWYKYLAQNTPKSHKKCPVCHKQFIVLKSREKYGGRFCSLECFQSSRATPTISCANCGKRRKLRTRQELKDKNYCSRRCAYSSRRRFHEPRKCFNCQRIYSKHTPSKRGLMFCSQKCSLKYKSKFSLSPPEILLAEQLKKSKVAFRQQATIGFYKIDFLINNLAVEVDGPSHRWNPVNASDKKRTAFLKLKGYDILRLPNELILSNPQKAVNIITSILQEPHV